jgi:hypothetical protein
LVAVADTVTLVPAHTVVEGLATIATEAVGEGVTVIVIGVDVAGEPDEQLKLEVI